MHLLGVCDMVVVVTSLLLRICQYLFIRYWGSYSLSIPGGSGSGNAVKVTKNVNQDQCDKRRDKNMWIKILKSLKMCSFFSFLPLRPTMSKWYQQTLFIVEITKILIGYSLRISHTCPPGWSGPFNCWWSERVQRKPSSDHPTTNPAPIESSPTATSGAL